MPIFTLASGFRLPKRHTVSTWHDTFWLMSDFVPVRGNISYQNGNMSTPLISPIHSFKQMQSVTKLTFTSRSWPLKSMGISLYKAFATYAPRHCLDRWDSESRSTSTQFIRSEHEFAIHSQGVELPDFTVSTWYPVIILSVSHVP